jgi:peptidoglycan/xylan/chitin deacetylase (PgdA/CDA1 family)
VKNALNWLKKHFQPSCLILMYHRINKADSDPWGLCVRPERFAEHLEILRQEAVPLPLPELVRAHREGVLPRGAIAVTFDDGYADNLSNATPLLERFHIPATVFVTSGYIGSEREFWWDELEQVLLQPRELPATLHLTIRHTACRWKLGEAAHYGEEEYRREVSQKAWDGKPGSRHHLYYAVWQVLQPLTEDERHPVLDAISAWAGAEPALRESHRPLEGHELQTLALSDVIEIGAHTVTHPRLSVHPLAMQAEEIRASKTQLEKWLDRPVTSFAYPYGDFLEETPSLVRDAGFACACTTREGSVRWGANCLALPRVQVEDWDGHEFRKRLRGWFRC